MTGIRHKTNKMEKNNNTAKAPFIKGSRGISNPLSSHTFSPRSLYKGHRIPHSLSRRSSPKTLYKSAGVTQQENVFVEGNDSQTSHAHGSQWRLLSLVLSSLSLSWAEVCVALSFSFPLFLYLFFFLYLFVSFCPPFLFRF